MPCLPHRQLKRLFFSTLRASFSSLLRAPFFSSLRALKALGVALLLSSLAVVSPCQAAERWQRAAVLTDSFMEVALKREYQPGNSASLVRWQAPIKVRVDSQLGNSRKIADTIRLQAIYTVSPRVSLTARYEHLIAGPALTDANYKSSDFLAGWISFRF